MIIAEIGIVAAVAAIVFGAIALQNPVREEISTTPTPTPTSLSDAPLISGVITTSTGKTFASGVPLQVLAFASDDGLGTLVEAGATGDDGAFAITTTRIDSLEEFASDAGLVALELRASTGNEVVSYPFTVNLAEVDGVLTLTGLTDVHVTSLYEAPPVVTPTVAKIVISSLTLQLQSSSGEVLSEFKYFENDHEAVIAALTEAFGADPQVGRYEGNFHYPGGDKYDWGGLALFDSPSEIDSEIGMHDFAVTASAAVVSGVRVETSEGIAVGASFSELESEADYEKAIEATGGNGTIFYFDEQELEDQKNYQDYTDHGRPAAYSIYTFVAEGDAVLSSFTAPSSNFMP
jgi:hypothetical protein